MIRTITIALLGLVVTGISAATEPSVCPPGCVPGALSGVRECPPGYASAGITWCQEVHRECETVTGALPTGEAIRAAIRSQTVPEGARPLIDEVLSWPAKALEDGYYRAIAAARCFSGGDKGPADPDAVPDAQVKTWVLAVLERGEPRERALRPLVAGLPDSFIATAWRAAVRLKRAAGGGGS